MEVSESQAKAVAAAVGLDLPPERVTSLARMLDDFMTQFEAVRAIDKGDREPATQTWDLEV